MGLVYSARGLAFAFVRMTAMAVGVSFFSSAFAQTKYTTPVTRGPVACECFANEPETKKYLAEGKVFPSGVWREYTCEFKCMRSSGELDVLVGTQRDQFRVRDDGTHFICRGFVMKFMDTPMDPRRHGVYVLDHAKPFKARGSGIPEIEEWSRQTCGN